VSLGPGEHLAAGILDFLPPLALAQDLLELLVAGGCRWVCFRYTVAGRPVAVAGPVPGVVGDVAAGGIASWLLNDEGHRFLVGCDGL
jgi:hypothetical protein